MIYKFDITDEKYPGISTLLGNFETPEDAIIYLNTEKLANRRLGLWFENGLGILIKMQFNATKDSKPITKHSVAVDNNVTPRVATLGSEIIEEAKS